MPFNDSFEGRLATLNQKEEVNFARLAIHLGTCGLIIIAFAYLGLAG